jgi:hypothetical protein
VPAPSSKKGLGIADLRRNRAPLRAVLHERGDAVKTLKTSLIASLIGTAVGLGIWLSGLGQTIWPGHPQLASFLVTLVVTVSVQVAWPWFTNID